MAHAFCDLQMLRGADGRLVVKEFSVFNAEKDSSRTVIFKAPYSSDVLPEDVRKTNRVIFNHINGLKWENGTVPYDKYPDVIRQMAASFQYLYVKGEEKRELLRLILPNTIVINIERLGCPKLKTLPQYVVPFHGTEHGVFPSLSCACVNACKIGMWYEFDMV